MMTKADYPKISVIIPNYNDAETLPSCLEAILNSDYPDFEVIVVDDKSTDNSVEIIKNFEVKLLRHEKQQRQGAARNTGATEAKGEILLFIDGDVCVKEDTLKKIGDVFLEKKDITAVVGMPDKKCVYKNLASINFNRRVHYNYLKLPDYISVLYGSVAAVKKEVFLKIGGFNKNITGVEDNEVGLRLTNAGYKIFHSKDVVIVHHKKIDLISLFKNDFKRTVDRVKLLLGRHQIKKTIQEKRFITSPLYQLLSPFISFAVFCFLILGIFNQLFFWGTGLFLLLFFIINFGYIFFNFKDFGLFFSIKLFFLLLLDMFVVSLALIWGGVLFIKGEKY